MRRRYESESITKEQKEKIQRRVQWMIMQEKLRQHEKLKKQFIEEYEKRRAMKLGLDYKKDRRSRSAEHHGEKQKKKVIEEYEKQRSIRLGRDCKEDRRSRSEESHRTNINSTARSSFSNDENYIVSEKSNTFECYLKKPELSSKSSPDEMGVIKIEIYHNIATDRVIRKDIMLNNQERQGRKRVCDGDDLNKAETSSVKEYRTVEATTIISRSSAADKSCVKRRSTSLSPRRHRSPSPRERFSSGWFDSQRSRSNTRSTSCHDRRSREHRTDRRRPRSRDKSREDRYRDSSVHRRSRSHSRERNHRRTGRNYSRDCKEKECRDRRHRHRSLDRSPDRRSRRDASPSPKTYLPPLQYVEQIPYPVYFNGYPPRLLMSTPGIPAIRAPMARGNRIPIVPIRPPFPPRIMGPPFRHAGPSTFPRFR